MFTSTGHSTRHKEHCTLNTANCTLHTAHFTPYTAHYTLHAAYCKLHTTNYKQHTTHCMFHIAHFTMYTAHFKTGNTIQDRSQYNYLDFLCAPPFGPPVGSIVKLFVVVIPGWTKHWFTVQLKIFMHGPPGIRLR